MKISISLLEWAVAYDGRVTLADAYAAHVKYAGLSKAEVEEELKLLGIPMTYGGNLYADFPDGSTVLVMDIYDGALMATDITDILRSRRGGE